MKQQFENVLHYSKQRTETLTNYNIRLKTATLITVNNSMETKKRNFPDSLIKSIYTLSCLIRRNFINFMNFIIYKLLLFVNLIYVPAKSHIYLPVM